ncbi:MAG: hypothetical protein U1F34_02310 [Gammaproteobacteria bacterium]
MLLEAIENALNLTTRMRELALAGDRFELFDVEQARAAVLAQFSARWSATPMLGTSTHRCCVSCTHAMRKSGLSAMRRAVICATRCKPPIVLTLSVSLTPLPELPCQCPGRWLTPERAFPALQSYGLPQRPVRRGDALCLLAWRAFDEVYVQWAMQ